MYYQQTSRTWNYKHTENLGATKMWCVDRSVCLPKTGLGWKFISFRFALILKHVWHKFYKLKIIF